MKTSQLFAAIAACLLLPSCMSGTIVASGKSYEHLLTKKTTAAKVRRSLGAAAWSKAYDPPIPINQTKEYKAYDRKGHVFVWNGDDTSEEAVTALCEVYTRKGPFFDMDRGQGYAMASGLTLGIGDLYYLPDAIKERKELSEQYFSKTFWYDATSHFIGCFDGDIRDVKD